NTLKTATFNIETLRRRAGEKFITVTELADTIVRREDLSFRVAHHIVAESVKTAIEKRSEITHEILQGSAKKITGSELSLTFEDLQQALSPENFVSIRKIYGGPAPEETRRALVFQRDDETTDEKWFAQSKTFIEESAIKLQTIVDKVIKG
nr:argininosuccinate lyase [Acidobacteriota bacterium]